MMKKEKRTKAKVRLSFLVIMLVCSLLLVGAGIYMFGSGIYNQTGKAAERTAQGRMENFAGRTDAFLTKSRCSLTMTSVTLDYLVDKGFSEAEILDFLTKETAMLLKNVDYEYVGLSGIVGDKYYDGDKNVMLDAEAYKNCVWYKRAIENPTEAVVVSSFTDPDIPNGTIRISKALSDGVGVVSLDALINGPRDIARDIVNAGGGFSRAFVLDTDKNIVSSSDSEYFGANIGDILSDDFSILSAKDLENGTSRRITVMSDGREFQVFYSDVAAGWSIILAMSTEEVYRDSQTILKRVSSLALILLAVIFSYTLLSFVLETKRAKEEQRKLDAFAVSDSALRDNYETLNCITRKHDFVGVINMETGVIRKYKVDGLFAKYIENNTETFSKDNLDEVLQKMIPSKEYGAFCGRVNEDFLLKTLQYKNEYGFVFSVFDEGEFFYYRVDFLKKNDDLKEIVICFADSTDIVKERREKGEAMFRASRDGLTALLNRGAFIDKIKEQTADSGLQGAALICINLDYFKKINDEYGHKKGDEILRNTADLIKSVFRHNAILGRLGGDEFGIFVTKVTEQLLTDRLETLIRLIKSPDTDGNDTISVTACIGCAYCITKSSDVDRLYAHADDTMKSVKRNGKDGYRLITI